MGADQDYFDSLSKLDADIGKRQNPVFSVLLLVAFELMSGIGHFAILLCFLQVQVATFFIR
jgi:hypothetical protein